MDDNSNAGFIGDPYESAAPTRKAAPLFDTWERHTIMSGKVVSYAESFEGSGLFPDGKEAIGGFEISASRDAVMCHRMAINDRRQKDAFEAAFRAAWAKHLQLKN